MDPLWLVIAFLGGLLAQMVRLPPLVGFLAAGFALHALGVTSSELLEQISDLGITLLLFTIGLKLNLRSLARPEIWAGASIHMVATVCVFSLVLAGLVQIGFPLLGLVDLQPIVLVAFALSFSSTVFAVKILEERGELPSLHGRVAVGILIVQDVYAVIFLSLSEENWPSPWAILLIVGTVLLRPLLIRLMVKAGHGELLLLYGMLLALTLGAWAFELVKLKPGVGALIVGMVLAGSPRSGELARSLLGLKDLFLVGFFLTIGLSDLPGWQEALVAGALAIAVVVKMLLYNLVLGIFRLRARTSFLASASLANYSEFGLIVSAAGVAGGWISNRWLITIALTVSMSFVLAALINMRPHTLYARLSPLLRRYESLRRLPDERLIDLGDVDVAIFGMGRIGTRAYDDLRDRFEKRVIGVDFNSEKIQQHRAEGRRVIVGDATDPDFWERLEFRVQPRLVMLAMPGHKEHMYALRRLSESPYRGGIAVIARYEDEVDELRSAGAHAAFNIYSEAGAGFAEHVCDFLSGEKFC